ncbi:MAG: hypothetical protein Kow0059_05450 [Candidatus Sumerlaeia bacterium]
MTSLLFPTFMCGGRLSRWRWLILAAAALVLPGVARPQADPQQQTLTFTLWLDRAGTSTLAHRLESLERMRRRYSEMRFSAPDSPALRRAGAQIHALARDFVSTPALILAHPHPLLLAADPATTAPFFDPRLADVEIEETAGEILAGCAAAVLDQAARSAEHSHWLKCTGAAETDRLYREAGRLLTLTLDALPDPALRRRVSDAAPVPVRPHLVLLTKLLELYRADPPPIPHPSPAVSITTRPEKAPPALPAPKIEPAWMTLARRIQAFQSVMPEDLMTGGDSPGAAADLVPALDSWFAARRWAVLSVEERRRTRRLWSRAGADGDAMIGPFYAHTGPGPDAWRRLLSQGGPEERAPSRRPSSALDRAADQHRSSSVLSIAVWDILTESPELCRRISLEQSAGGAPRLLWTPEGAPPRPLLITDVPPFAELDYEAIAPPLAEGAAALAYRGAGSTSAVGDRVAGSRDALSDFRFSILRDVPGRSFAERRLNLAPWLEQMLAPRLEAAGLTPDHPQWAVKRDLLAQPFLQALVHQYMAGGGGWSAGPALAGSPARRPEGFEAWLVEQLKRDYTASLDYHERSRAQDERFFEARDALLDEWPAADLWRRIYRLQSRLEAAVVDAMTGLIVPRPQPSRGRIVP